VSLRSPPRMTSASGAPRPRPRRSLERPSPRRAARRVVRRLRPEVCAEHDDGLRAERHAHLEELAREGRLRAVRLDERGVAVRLDLGERASREDADVDATVAARLAQMHERVGLAVRGELRGERVEAALRLHLLERDDVRVDDRDGLRELRGPRVEGSLRHDLLEARRTGAVVALTDGVEVTAHVEVRDAEDAGPAAVGRRTVRAAVLDDDGHRRGRDGLIRARGRTMRRTTPTNKGKKGRTEREQSTARGVATTDHAATRGNAASGGLMWNVHALLLRTRDRLLVARVGVADDPMPGSLVSTRSRRFAASGVPSATRPCPRAGSCPCRRRAVMEAHPARPRRRVHERVEDRPVRDRVGPVLHRLGLAVSATPPSRSRGGSRPMTIGAFHLAGANELVEREADLRAVAVPRASRCAPAVPGTSRAPSRARSSGEAPGRSARRRAPPDR